MSTSQQPSAELISFLECFPGSHLFCSIPPDHLTEISPIHWPGPISKAYQSLRDREKHGWATYFTVNESCTNRRLIADMRVARAVFIDDDIPRESGPRRDFILKPSIIVESSKNKYHYYWLTSTEDLETWRAVQVGLIALYNTDPAIKDSSRVLRLPTFTHKTGFITKIIDFNKKLYSWETILQNYPPLYEDAVNDEGEIQGGEFDLISTIDKFINAKSIAPSMNSLIMHWTYRYKEDYIRNHLVSLFNSIPQEVYAANSKRYESARHQIDKFIKSAKNNVKSDAAPSISFKNVKQEIKVPDALEWDWSILRSNPIPEECIPDALLEAAKEIGEWTATGQDPAILSAVFITSALLSKNIVIHEIGDDLTTHCQSGIIIVMDTGARKSSIYEQMNKPFFEYENKIAEDWAKNKNVNIAMVALLQKQLDKAKRKAEGIESSMEELLSSAVELGALQDHIDSIQVKRPWLRAADVTQEKLVRKLDENHGTIAIISDDARQTISNLKGQYSKDNTGEGVYINALTGSDILYERVGSDKEIHIKKPVLNALLFVQPDAALSLKNSEMYVPSGLAARLPMYFYPISGVDIIEKTSRRSINLSRMSRYYECLRKLCFQRFDLPLHIVLGEGGMDACRKMDKALVTLLRDSWRGHYDKINKIVTLSIMYSVVFAALEDPEFSSKFRDTRTNEYNLSVKYLNMGFMFAKSLFSQSICSYELVSQQDIPRKAEACLGIIQKFYSTRKIYEGFVMCGDFKNSFNVQSRDDLPAIIDFLREKNWLITSIHTSDKKKLNNGFPDKFVVEGDLVYHLNVEGIEKRRDMRLGFIEESLLDGIS